VLPPVSTAAKAFAGWRPRVAAGTSVTGCASLAPKVSSARTAMPSIAAPW
jgi:hypothetical protein